jgi:2-amino-4-hydroxy-6-hydroxymethyldihydropteridine diphosphokinase
MAGAADQIVYLSMGSNLGDRADNCRRAVDALDGVAGDVLVVSPLYRTSPVDFEEQAWFVNGAVKLRSTLPPLRLLKVIKGIETAFGRKEGGIRFGPRILDLDIIFFDDAVIDVGDLVVPHPRLHQRGFVLQPLCDINPDIFHPVLNQTVKQLLDNLDDHSQKVLPYP